MNILVTGSQGFIGKNLVSELKNLEGYSIFEFDLNQNPNQLDYFCEHADFVFHLAGINRPTNPEDFQKGNVGLTEKLIDLLNKFKNPAPIILSSSIQAELNNPYGKSKKEAEERILHHGHSSTIYRLPNVFGKWGKPNYNSVVATFCHNISREIPITINDPTQRIKLVYVDDVITQFIDHLKGSITQAQPFHTINPTYEVTVGEIANTLQSFKDSRTNFFIPNISKEFEKKLYSTYTSYIPEDEFSYKLKMNRDTRGSFTEFLKTPHHGQISVNISKPGITKGNHWHHTKTEKFLVVSGQGVIRLRNYSSEKISEYFVSGDDLEVIDIPTGYTHNIENLGTTDMVTIMWANEAFNPNKPDTYFLGV